MPFGMVNSGATLVRGLKKVLEGLSEVGSYIDDIVVYNDSWQEPNPNVHQDLSAAVQPPQKRKVRTSTMA